MRISAVIAASLACVGVAACGSTNTAQTTPTAVNGPGGPTTTAGTPASTAATLTAPHVLSTATTTAATGTATITTTSITSPDSGGAPLSTVTTAGTTQCVAGDLALAAVGPNSAPGTAVLGFTLRNTGSVSCHTGGWPGVALFTAGATDPVASTATRSTSDVLGSTPETPIVLAPGDEASFRLILSSHSNSDAGCHTVTTARFIAPNDTATMSVTIPDGAEYCGTASISPLEPGASGTGQ